MRIKMTATRDGANDGHTVRSYEEGQEYEVSSDLGKDFIAGHYAVEVEAAEPEAEAAAESDAAADAPAPPPAKKKK